MQKNMFKQTWFRKTQISCLIFQYHELAIDLEENYMWAAHTHTCFGQIFGKFRLSAVIAYCNNVTVKYPDKTLEIKTFGLGSRIWDMALWDEPNIELESHSVHWLWFFGL